MKKLKKDLFKVGLFLASQVFVNKIIFDKANLFSSNEDENNLYYSHKFGRVKYNVFGKKDSEPLVLIHGICAGGSSLEWENIVEPLSKKHRVYTLDLLGFGASDRPNISYNSYLYIDVINNFIRDIIGTPCNVVGSNTSADFLIMANKIKPSNFNKIILINPSGLVSPNLYTNYYNKLTKLILQSPIIGTSCYNILCSKFFIKYFLKKYVYTNPKLITKEEINKYYYPAHYEGEKNKVPISYFASGFLNVDSSKALLSTKTDTLVVFGEDNKFLPVYRSRDFAKNNSNISTIIFPFTKTSPHIERHVLFVKKINEFLEK